MKTVTDVNTVNQLLTYSKQAEAGIHQKSNTDVAWRRKTHLFIAGIRKDHKC